MGKFANPQYRLPIANCLLSMKALCDRQKKLQICSVACQLPVVDEAFNAIDKKNCKSVLSLAYCLLPIANCQLK